MACFVICDRAGAGVFGLLSTRMQSALKRSQVDATRDTESESRKQTSVHTMPYYAWFMACASWNWNHDHDGTGGFDEWMNGNAWQRDERMDHQLRTLKMSSQVKSRLSAVPELLGQ